MRTTVWNLGKPPPTFPIHSIEFRFADESVVRGVSERIMTEEIPIDAPREVRCRYAALGPRLRRDQAVAWRLTA